MKPQKNNIARNLTTLRQLNKYSQEDVAEQIGVSRCVRRSKSAA